MQTQAPGAHVHIGRQGCTQTPPLQASNVQILPSSVQRMRSVSRKQSCVSVLVAAQLPPVQYRHVRLSAGASSSHSSLYAQPLQELQPHSIPSVLR